MPRFVGLSDYGNVFLRSRMLITPSFLCSKLHSYTVQITFMQSGFRKHVIMNQKYYKWDFILNEIS